MYVCVYVTLGVCWRCIVYDNVIVIQMCMCVCVCDTKDMLDVLLYMVLETSDTGHV